VPIFLPNYYVGRWILRSEVSPPDFGKIANVTGGWFDKVSTWWSVAWDAILPLWVENPLVALALAVPTYFSTHYAVVIYQCRMHEFQLDSRPREAGDADPDGVQAEADPSSTGQD